MIIHLLVHIINKEEIGHYEDTSNRSRMREISLAAVSFRYSMAEQDRCSSLAADHLIVENYQRLHGGHAVGFYELDLHGSLIL